MGTSIIIAITAFQYLYLGICFALIAKKMNKNILIGIGMVVPVLNIFLLPLLAEEENYLLFLFMLIIPGVNLFAIANLIGNIAATLGKDKWLYGVGCLIPIIGYIPLSILAFSRNA